MNVLGRRARQARNGYSHIHEMARPKYRRRDASVAARRLAEQIATERRMKQNKKK